MTLLAIALSGGAGFALGLAHFHGLWRAVAAYAHGGVRTRVVVAHAGRLGGTVATLVFMARFGALPFVAGLVGFAAARSIVLAQTRRST